MYNFNTLGYLPYFIPVVAAYARQHIDAASQREVINGILMRERQQIRKQYYRKIGQYERKIIGREIEHRYRDGYGRILPGKFDLKRYLESDKENKLKKIIIYLIPPIIIWFKNKLLARYRVYQNISKIREDIVNNSKATNSGKKFSD